MKRFYLHGIFLLFFLFLFTACDSVELDADGGYFNEKTGKYKYVFPKQQFSSGNPQGVSRPSNGIVQQVKGSLFKIDSLDRIWLLIPERDTFSILAQGVTSDMKDEKNKALAFFLKYVNPELVSGSTQFKKKWKLSVLKSMEHFLLKKELVITFTYESKAKLFRGVVTFLSPEVSGSSRARNLNLLMIEQGLSLYLISEQPHPKLHSVYLEAERKAREQKLGIWKYSQ